MEAPVPYIPEGRVPSVVGLLRLVGGPAGSGDGLPCDPVMVAALPATVSFPDLLPSRVAVYRRDGDPFWVKSVGAIRYRWEGWADK